MENNRINIFDWFQDWFAENCENFYEDEVAVDIRSLSNPGWRVEIYFHSTSLVSVEVPHTLIENSEKDWLAFSFSNGVFKGYGDQYKLPVLLEKFKSILDTYYRA